MLLIPAAGLVLLFSVFVLAILRPPGRAAALLGLYLLSYANIVLVGEITNSFFQLNNRALWLLLEAGLVIAAWLGWRRAGSPVLLGNMKQRLWPGGWFASRKQWPELWLLASGVWAGFLFNGLLIWLLPPNNNDSLATHMARIGFWLQRGTFFPWPTDRIWQITYPVNMQLQIFWNVLFLGSDKIVESVQWLGAAAAMAAVYGLARLLGAARPQAVFAGLLVATFPEIILESTTTQNDLVAGTLFAAMLYLFFLGIMNKHNGALVLSGLAMALCLGTKQTLFFLIPGLGLTFVVVLIYQGRPALRGLLVWGAAAAGAFLLVGGYMFVVNQVYFGHPLGPETAVTGQTGGLAPQSLRDNLVLNTARLAYQAIDPTGLPDPLTGYGFKAKALVVGKLAGWIGFPIESATAVADKHAFVLRERYVLQEDAAWYGPLFSFLVLPAVAYQGWVGLKKKDPLRISIFLLGFTFWILDAALRPGWDPFQGRYFIPVVIIATACAAFVFRPGKRFGMFRWVISALALVIMTTTVLGNTAKPVSGQETIWGMTRTEIITRQSFYMREPIEMVERIVPADACLGLLTLNTGLEYPYFGESFRRRLVHVYPSDRLQDEEWLQDQGIEFVLVLANDQQAALQYAPGLIEVAYAGEWVLLAWEGAGNGEIGHANWPQ